MDRLTRLDREGVKENVPEFGVGDTVKVHYKVVEAGRERTQQFQGSVIKVQNGGIRETFTVRKISFGVGVERTFPLNSPRIAAIDVLTRGKVRRARLFYLRTKVGKAARIKEKR